MNKGVVFFKIILGFCMIAIKVVGLTDLLYELIPVKQGTHLFEREQLDGNQEKQKESQPFSHDNPKLGFQGQFTNPIYHANIICQIFKPPQALITCPVM